MKIKNKRSLWGHWIKWKNILEENVLEDNSSLIGLYDPKDNDLKIDMENSDGDQVNYIIEKLFKMDLSNDAHDILKIAILTNSYIPGINMDQKNLIVIR